MSTSTVSAQNSQTALANHLNKSFYQADQQAKLIYLQSEVDSLLQQLQNLKMQRLATSSKE